MKASDVIMTGRNLRRALSIALSSNGRSVLAFFFRKLNDQDGVLRGKADEHDHADLGIEIEGQTPDQNRK